MPATSQRGLPARLWTRAVSRIGGIKLQALLIGAGQHDAVVEGLRAAECDVGLEGVHQSRHVHLDELQLGEVCVTTCQGEEFVSVVLDRARAAKEHDLVDRAVRHGQSETLLHELGEAAPRQCAPREFQPAIP